MGARFTITKGVELVKGMTCGRVQLPKGETPIESVVRRISRETGLRLLTIKRDVDAADASINHYELMLGRGRGRAVAGAVCVTITT
jgi:hypothetical protein